LVIILVKRIAGEQAAFCSSNIACCASDRMSYSKTRKEEKRDKNTYEIKPTRSPAEEEEELRAMNDI